MLNFQISLSHDVTTVKKLFILLPPNLQKPPLLCLYFVVGQKKRALDSRCFYLLTLNVQLTNKMTYKNILLAFSE